jgi:hypothetical protein
MRTRLAWTPHADGICFDSFAGGALPALPLEPSPTLDGDPGLQLLESLWGEDRTLDSGQGHLLSWDEVYELGQSDRATLKLPEPSDALTGRVRTEQWVNATDFRIWVEVEHLHGGQKSKMLDGDRSGLIFNSPAGPLLPRQHLGRLVRLLEQPLPPTTAERTVLVAKAKQLARDSGVEIDQYLTQEEYVFPEGLGIEVTANGRDELRLRSTVEGIDGDPFENFDTEEGPTKTTYTQFLGEGRRRRLVLTGPEREAVDDVREGRVLRGADIPKFLDNPEAFVPDIFDLQQFSPRVRGLIPQRYHSQPYLRVKKSGQRGWFEVSPEIELLADPSGLGASTDAALVGVDLGDGATLPPWTDGAGATPEVGEEATGSISPTDYKALCEKAIATEEPYQLHGDAWVHIDLERANRFLESYEQLDEREPGKFFIPESRVSFILDVISNTDELEYEEEAAAFFSEPRVPDYPLPKSLTATLLPHQEKGYRWMRYLRENQLGGLLADDMGLGKTVQVIAFLAHLHETNALMPTLVVVPKSLMKNWQREIGRFAPDIRRILLHRGPGRTKDPHHLALYEVVITTYATLRRDQLILGQVDWSTIVCDEAQNVKNPTANVTTAVKGMKAGLRMAATGTPVENGLSELWCIMDFAQPGKLGSRRDFRDNFERPIVDAEAGTEIRLEASRRLQDRLVPHYVRRTKEQELKDLPAKTSETYSALMGTRQKHAYARVLKSVADGETIAISGLTKLIQACSHAELVEPTGADAAQLLEESPKLTKTIEILKGIRDAGEKGVIFTRFREMQRILGEVIAATFGFYPKIINGDVDGDNRQTLVDLFNARPGFHVMILSPDAAGVGLNITGANHAIHYTRLWNPAKENQATDRLHRMGQLRPVTVHYPVVEGAGFKSVEQHLDELLSEKLALAGDVLIPRDMLDVTGKLRDLIAIDAEEAE